jgi:hypothetical protein
MGDAMTHADWLRELEREGIGLTEFERAALLAGAAALEREGQQADGLRLMAVRWMAEADGVEATGYSQQADRIRECANELRAALSGERKGEDDGD